MKFSLIICTYQRPESLNRLLDSVAEQNLPPDEILVVDGSTDKETEILMRTKKYPKLRYFKVEDQDRGLTRQRNYGIERTGKDIEIICFLDDDIILEPFYFEKLIKTYTHFTDAIGVGGYILNEIKWKQDVAQIAFDEFKIDGWVRKLGKRNLFRKKLGLLSDQPPGYMPEFSNGLSIGFFPPSGKTYPVEFFMGGVASYRKSIFDTINFSEYFEGYGLYEDMDFCLRTSRLGLLYVNTAAQVNHYHEPTGRPNYFKYGKMVIRNGWYVWRVKYPKPDLKHKFKWLATAILLTGIRIGNVISTSNRKDALLEGIGRLSGLISLLYLKPEQK